MKRLGEIKILIFMALNAAAFALICWVVFDRDLRDRSPFPITVTFPTPTLPPTNVLAFTNPTPHPSLPSVSYRFVEGIETCPKCPRESDCICLPLEVELGWGGLPFPAKTKTFRLVLSREFDGWMTSAGRNIMLVEIPRKEPRQ